MNVLIITPHLPYPDVPHAGGQDLFRLIAFLAERHSISVVGFADDAQAAHAAELQPYISALTVIRPALIAGRPLSRLIAALRRDEWWSMVRSADAQVHAAIRAAEPDVLFAFGAEMGGYLRQALPGCVRVLDEVDVHSIVDPKPALRAGELAYYRAADLVIAHSARDLAALRAEVPALRGLVIPPVGHVTDYLTIQPEASQCGRVQFASAMNRQRNQEAARWLLDTIWPLVRAAISDATLRIVGAAPPRDIQARSGMHGIEVTGWVSDLRVKVATSRVVVAPMRSEGGALTKVIDALAAGRPVVATSAANAGVDAPPDAIMLADDPEAFADAIIRLLRDDAAWRTIAEAGRHFAATFDWRGAVEALEADLLEMLAEA